MRLFFLLLLLLLLISLALPRLLPLNTVCPSLLLLLLLPLLRSCV